MALYVTCYMPVRRRDCLFARWIGRGRAHRSRDCMGWTGGVLEGSGWGKPKGTHQRSYELLCDQHDTFEGLCCTNRLTAGLPLLPDRLIPRPL